MERLVAKHKEIDNQKDLEVYHAGGKTTDDIVAFMLNCEELEELQKPRKRQLRVKQ